MVLVYQIIQVLRRAQLRARGARAIGFQPAHRTVRCSVAVQRDCLRAALLAFDRFTKERLGGRDIALGAQPEVDRPTCPIDGAIQVAPFASDLVVCAIDRPRSAIISTRSRRLSLNRRYQRTHRMTILRSKWRPLNSSSAIFSLPIADLSPFSMPA